MRVETFSPTDLGVPSQRQRQYTSLNLHPCMKEDFQSFDAMFFRELVADASVYLEAVPDFVQVHKVEARARALKQDSDAACQHSLKQLDALTPGTLARWRVGSAGPVGPQQKQAPSSMALLLWI